jgi:hypothetical protein
VRASVRHHHEVAGIELSATLRVHHGFLSAITISSAGRFCRSSKRSRFALGR